MANILINAVLYRSRWFMSTKLRCAVNFSCITKYWGKRLAYINQKKVHLIFLIRISFIKFFFTFITFMPGWHSGLLCWLSGVLNYNALQVRSQPCRDGPLCAVCILLCMAISFAVLPGVLMYVSYMGELTVWIVFPTVAVWMYRSSPLVPLDSCLTATASQARDLALLVGYFA